MHIYAVLAVCGAASMHIYGVLAVWGAGSMRIGGVLAVWGEQHPHGVREGHGYPHGVLNI